MRARKVDQERDVGGRERLLEAAVSVFGTKGYAAASVRDILRSAGVTAPVLYHHFGNKEGLWKALVREGLVRLEVARQRALAGAGSTADRIRRFCRATLKVRQEHADLHRVIWEILAGPPEAAPRLDIREQSARVMERLRGLVQDGVDSGELRPCNTLHVALALMACLDAASGLRPFEPPDSDPADELDGMLSVILGGLAAHSA